MGKQGVKHKAHSNGRNGVVNNRALAGVSHKLRNKVNRRPKYGEKRQKRWEFNFRNVAKSVHYKAYRRQSAKNCNNKVELSAAYVHKHFCAVEKQGSGKRK